MKTSNIIILIAIFISGCVNPINERNAQFYFKAGNDAIAHGDLIHAKKMFLRALVNANVGGMKPEAKYHLYMKLGRISGNLCEHEEAEKYFLEILKLYKEKDTKTSKKVIFITTLELGQFNYDIGSYKKSTEYFEQALNLDGNGLKNNSPSSYYEVLTDYSDALVKTGMNKKAKNIKEEIKNNKQHLTKESAYERYPKECK